MTTTKEQYLISGVIFGVGAMLLLAMALTGIYGLFHGGPVGLVNVVAVLGLLGSMSACMTYYVFRKALTRIER